MSAPTLAARLRDAAQQLESVTDTPRLDAELLAAHALGISRSKLLAQLHSAIDIPGYEVLLDRRLAYEPIAYIVGHWEFYALDFIVEPPMLVPRPETEHVVEAVLDFVQDTPATILEAGVGTGCIAISIAVDSPKVQAIGTDLNPAAIELARRNAYRHEVDDRVTFYEGDLFAPVPSAMIPADVVCSNPPYVEDGAWPTLSPVIRLHEDRRALLAGPDGLDIIRRLIGDAYPLLRPGGLLAFELGMGQYGEVADLLEKGGYMNIGFVKDLAGIKRVATAYRPGK